MPSALQRDVHLSQHLTKWLQLIPDSVDAGRVELLARYVAKLSVALLVARVFCRVARPKGFTESVDVLAVVPRFLTDGAVINQRL